MWLTNLPASSEELRQGDLLVGIPFPTATSVSLTGDGLAGAVAQNATAVVLDHCCTVEQKHVVMLA